MPNLTLSLPEELKQKMEEFPEINWSALIRRYVESKVNRLVWKEQMLKQLESEGEFDEEALRLGDKIKDGMWKRYKEAGW